MMLFEEVYFDMSRFCSRHPILYYNIYESAIFPFSGVKLGWGDRKVELPCLCHTRCNGETLLFLISTL